MLLRNGQNSNTSVSKKDQEMMEIAALIRKAQAVTEQAV